MMKRRQWLKNAWGLGLGLSAWHGQGHAQGHVQAPSELHWKRIDFLGLGTNLSIQAGHRDEQTLVQALSAARQCLTDIESQMSLFKENSALRQLNREGVLAHPPAHLLAVLKQAQHYAQHSGGAFDATVQPLWEVFAQAQLSGALPSAAQVQAARRLVNWRDVSVSPERVALARAGMGVTLNGIAQGYASDQLRQVLQAHGVADALVNAGEWSASGHSPRSDDWVIGLASPQPSDTLLAKLHVSGACVATSADDQTHFSEDHRHHHIFDPHTGYSPTDIASVSVVAPTCTQADALTKVLFVAGYDKALSVAQQWKVQALVVHKSGRHQMSKDLPLA